MRRFLALVVLVLVALAVVYRQRLFVRDPLGSVERDGVRQESARVFINYANDVLVEDSNSHQSYLLQAWNATPGMPVHLACVQGLACLTDADQATTVPLGGAGHQSHAAMSAKEVTFVDETGARIRIALR